MPPYKEAVGQSLSVPDFEKHLSFCSWFTNKLDTNLNLAVSILWSDESRKHAL